MTTFRADLVSKVQTFSKSPHLEEVMPEEASSLILLTGYCEKPS